MGKKNEGKAYVPTEYNRALVRRMAGALITRKDIAAKLDISEHTLRKHFGRELAEGKVDTLEVVSQKGVDLAKEGDTVMIKEIMTRRGGWATPQEEAGEKESEAATRLMNRRRSWLEQQQKEADLLEKLGVRVTK